jgi:hypothetical protein
MPDHLLEHGAQGRNHAGGGATSDLLGADLMEIEELHEEGGVFIRQTMPLGGEPPMGDQGFPFKHPGLDVGVADVQTEQHR